MRASAPRSTWWPVVAALVPMVAVLAGRGLLLLALALAVPVLVAVIERPQRGLLLLAALVPFDGLLLIADLPDQAAAWKEVLLAVTALAALRLRLLGRTGPRPVPGWVWALVALAVVAAVTVPLSDASLLRSIVGMKVLFFGALAGVVAVVCPLDWRDRDRLVSIFGVVGAVVAVVGLWQQVVGPERLNELGYAYNSVIRFSGSTMRSWSTFNQPFPFGYYLMVVVLLCGAVALAHPRRFRNRLLLWAMPLYVGGLLTSVVKGAWLALLVGSVHLALTRHRDLLHAAPVAAGLAAIGLLFGLGAFFASDSLFERFDRWSDAPAAVAAEPWGEGVGAAGAAAAKAEGIAGGSATSRGRAGATLEVYQPDNHYVKVGFELGVVGLWLFVLALMAAYATARRMAGLAGGDPLAAGVASIVVAAAVGSMGATFFEIFPLDYLFWLLVGVVSIPAGMPRLGQKLIPSHSTSLT